MFMLKLCLKIALHTDNSGWNFVLMTMTRRQPFNTQVGTQFLWDPLRDLRVSLSFQDHGCGFGIWHLASHHWDHTHEHTDREDRYCYRYFAMAPGPKDAGQGLVLCAAVDGSCQCVCLDFDCCHCHILSLLFFQFLVF